MWIVFFTRSENYVAKADNVLFLKNGTLEEKRHV